MKYFVTYGDTPFQNMLALFKASPHTRFSVIVTEHKKKRSHDQNALMWVWLSIIGKELGYTSEEIHEALKARILGVIERKTVFGNVVNEPRSTTTLTTKEFSEYLNAIEAFAGSLGMTLPQPSHYGMEKF